jgi:hypothetical protein
MCKWERQNFSRFVRGIKRRKARRSIHIAVGRAASQVPCQKIFSFYG